ncbi:MAG: protein kinase [Planctomycetota bacterium]
MTELVGQPLEPGDELGPYRVEGELGRGSMGVVYRAAHTETRAPVALKVLAPRRAFVTGERERFLREARAGAELAHPGIVRTLDAGQDGGVLWLALERIPGRSLRELLREGPLTPQRAAELALDVADALAYAHARGVIHRDVKPDNVLVRDEDGRALLTDFGLARRREDVAQTHDGRVVGTPLYMAPEQARGERVDLRADIYGLGATLYEALTRATPYDDEREVGTDELLARVANEAPRALRAAHPALAPALAAIVDQALAPHPDDRYRSASDLAADLRRFLEGSTVFARPPGRLRALRRWLGRRARGLALGAALLVLLGAGLLVVSLVGKRWQADAQVLRAAELYRAGSDAAANAALDEALGLWPEHVGARVQRGALFLRARRALEARAEYEAALALRPAHVGALVGRARACLLLHDAEGALADARRARELAEPDDPRPALEGGLILYELGQGDEALGWLREGLEHARGRTRPDDPRRVQALLRAGELELERAQLEAALAHLEEAVALRRGDEEAALLLARACLTAGRPEAAEELSAGVLRRDPRAVPARLLRAEALREQGRCADALHDLAGLEGLSRARLTRGLLRLEALPADLAQEGFDYEGARADLEAARQALDLAPRERALAELGLGLACGPNTDPFGALDRASKLAPEAPGPLLASGCLRLEAGDPGTADLHFERAAALRGGEGPGELGRALAAERSPSGVVAGSRLVSALATLQGAERAWGATATWRMELLPFGRLSQRPPDAGPARVGARAAARARRGTAITLASNPWGWSAALCAQGDAELRAAVDDPVRFARHLRRALACYRRAQQLAGADPWSAGGAARVLDVLGSFDDAERERARAWLNAPTGRGVASARSELAHGDLERCLAALGPAEVAETSAAATLRQRVLAAKTARDALLVAHGDRLLARAHVIAAREARVRERGTDAVGQLVYAFAADPSLAEAWEERAQQRLDRSERPGAFLDAAAAAELDAARADLALRIAPQVEGALGRSHPFADVAEALLALARGGEPKAPNGASTWLSDALAAGLALRRGELAQVAPLLERARAAAPRAPLLGLLEAARRARAGDAQGALAALRALPSEPGLVGLARSLPELAPLRQDPAFRRWVEAR